MFILKSFISSHRIVCSGIYSRRVFAELIRHNA